MQMSKAVAEHYAERKREQAALARKAALWDALEAMQHAEIYIDKTGGPGFPVAIHVMTWKGDAEFRPLGT